MDTEPLRSAQADRTELPDYDYVSPGLDIVLPDHAFPNMVVGDSSIPRWPFLRRWVEQNWYSDRRNPHAGFANRDEASILYNSALLFQGKPCLEVGCWRGWSAVHLALGSGTLDIIDPIFGDPDFADSIRQSCHAAGVLDRVRFHEGFSPGAIDTLSQATHTRWSLMFIDAEHEGDAPQRDAEAALRNCADTAMVLFHDLASPDVAAGLDTMRNAGWRTRVYQTMQIMGVAWRGDVEPVPHTPDPRVFWTLPSHLAGYEVSGWPRPRARAEGAWWPGMTDGDRRAAAMMRAQAAEDERNVALRGARVAVVERDAAGARAEAAETRLAAIAAAAAHADQRDAELNRRIGMAEAARDAALDRAGAQDSRVEAQGAELEELSRRSRAAEAEQARIAHQLEAADLAINRLTEENRRARAERDTMAQLHAYVLTATGDLQRDIQAVFAAATWFVRRRVLLGMLRRRPAARIERLRARAGELGVAHVMTDPVVASLCRRRTLIGLFRRSGLAADALVSCRLLQAAQAVHSRRLRDTAIRLGESTHDMHLVPLPRLHG